MSLVNLAHVCSHLQNASLARLGLTSIPYTKWHLSLSLLLLKEGFISSVKLGGPSPPSSSFGSTLVPDHHIMSNHPYPSSLRDPRSPEAALALMVREARDATSLRDSGFPPDAVAFAETHGVRSAEELRARGWAEEVARFVLSVRARAEALVAERDDEVAARRAEDAGRREGEASRVPHAVMQADQAWADQPVEERRRQTEAAVVAELPVARQAVFAQYRGWSEEELARAEFPHEVLATLAGPHTYRTETDIERDGITITAMGLQIHRQPLVLPRREYQDTRHVEDEGVVTQENRASRRLWLGLKYYQSKPVLSKLQLVSKPTKRIWLDNSELADVIRGKRAGQVMGLRQVGEIMAISTDKGIMEARECVERRIGGMALCRMW